MKKKIFLASLCALMLVPLGACDKGGDTSVEQSGVGNSEQTAVQHEYVKQDAVAATCETAGNEEYYTCTHCDGIFDANKKEIDAIPTVDALGHDLVLQAETQGTCATKGKAEHYACSDCGKLFDLTEEEITDVEGAYDYSNHQGTAMLDVQGQPAKTAYVAGETFDPTGLTVTYKCGECDGVVVDNQFLTYTYQTEGATAFTNGDTKVTVHYGDQSFDVEVTTSKAKAEILGVEEAYTTVCGIAPKIEATCNIATADIVIEYYEDGEKIAAEDMVAGKTYAVKVSVAETDVMEGAEVTATVSVQHAYTWQAEEGNLDKRICVCSCGDAKEFYAHDNQILYVDDADMSIDLSKAIEGTADYSVKSIQQIQLLNDKARVDVEGTNVGMVYTFDKDLYEKTAFDKAEDGTITYYTPYELALAITYTVEGTECEVTYIVKYVDKVIRNAEDLAAIMYQGGHGATADSVATAISGHYVLAGDINAADLVINSNPCFIADGGFRGVFEGNGYTISNLTIPQGCNGLFGAIGYNAKIQNVTFDNVIVVPEKVTLDAGTYVLAFAMRNASLKNVTVNFSENSNEYKLCNEINDCELENVNITLAKGATAYFSASKSNVEVISYDYLAQYTVTFDTDGGNAIEPVSVTVNKKLAAPEKPIKTAEDNYYVFSGWYFNDAAWDFNTPITEDIELVAVWTVYSKAEADLLIDPVEEKIAVLPDSVTMPDHLYFVSKICAVQDAYNGLPDDLKANVENYEKLASLLNDIKGYEAVYEQNLAGVDVVPSHVPNYTSTVGGTASIRTDELYGNVLTVTTDATGKAAVQFKNFPDVSKYSKIYVCVRVLDESCNVYMSDGITNDGWGDAWHNNWGKDGYWANANNWMHMSVDVSSGIISSNWALGLRTDVIGVSFEIAGIVGYSAPMAETEFTFGNLTDTQTTNEYGKVYNISREQYYVDNGISNGMATLTKGVLSAALPAGCESFTFWIYNPTASEQTFHLAGDVNGTWTDSKDTTILKAGQWTKVSISAEDIHYVDNGQWYVYISGANETGWQISTIYAVYAE